MFSLEPGGLENGVVNLANGLKADGFETSIVCLEKSGSFETRLSKDVSVSVLSKQKGISPVTVWKLARWVRSNRPDVIHTHNLGPLLYGVLACALAFYPLRILHGEHGTFREEDLTKKRLWMRKILYRLCIRVHTVSDTLSNYLAKLRLPKKKIISIINGVDSDRFRPVENVEGIRLELGLPPNAFVIGMVGRMIASKRHELVLNAFKELANRYDQAVLLFVGAQGDSEETVAEAIKNHPYCGRIHWVGHQADTLKYYQAMDLLVMPSSVEGLSNALLEAMSCGVPCLAHPSCGASEVIKDEESGFLRVLDSTPELVAELDEIISSSQSLLEIGNKARGGILKRFSLAAMVNRYEDMYRFVAGVRRIQD